MTRIALLRHGHTSWNREGRIQGRTDIPLDPVARADLRLLQLPESWRNKQICSSPLLRAVETAKLVARPPITVPALTEMDWGDWEGAKGAELRANPTSGYRDIEDWGWAYRPPGGESPAEVWQRLAPWLGRLDRDAVLVCHIGVMRVLLARAFDWDFTGPAPFAVKRNRLFVLDLDGDRLTPGDPLIVRLEARV